jgi:pimeloyl-ACP methyl ester carboxylesterase
VPGVNGLDLHVLEAGIPAPDRPPLLLLHGFPDLASMAVGSSIETIFMELRPFRL